MDRNLVFSAFLTGMIFLPSIGNTEDCKGIEWDCYPPEEVCFSCCRSFELQGRVGYRFLATEKSRKMFTKGFVEYQVEGSYFFDRQTSCFVNVGYGFKKGHSIGLHNSTRISFVPISLGVAFSLDLPYCMQFRLGAGATFAYLDTKNYSHFVPKHISTSGGGGVIKVDLRLPFSECYFAGIFADYSFLYFPENRKKELHHIPEHRNKDFQQRRSFDASGVVTGAFAGFNF